MSHLGLVRVSALVVGNTIGAGIYFLPVSLAPFGALSLLGWLLTSCGSIVLALVFAHLARDNAKAGGPYAYTKQALGPFLGFQSAWSYWAAAWISNAAVAVATVSYLSVFWPFLQSNRIASCCMGLFIIWGVTFINALGVKQASSIQVLLTVLKLSPLIIIGIVGLFNFNTNHFVPFNQSNMTTISAIHAVAILTLWAFIGIESGTVPAQHIKNPRLTIPRATIYGTLLCAVIYMCVTFSVLGLIPAQKLAQSSAPLADAALILFGPWAAPLVAFGAVISALGCLLGWVLLQAQIPYAAALDGLFPAFFAKLSRRNVPLLGLVLSSMLMSVLMLMNFVKSLAEQFTLLVNLSVFIVLVPYIFSTIANILNQKSKNFKSLSISLIAFLYATWLIMGSGKEAIIGGLLFLLVGSLVYKFMNKKIPSPVRGSES
jgi:APA family basic amino acid/polyamine antiporter